MPNGEGLFHLHVGWISRGDGRDVVAAAAYRAAARLANEQKGQASDFTHKADRTLHSEIVLPPGSPSWAEDRAKLWNMVTAVERRADARLATEIEFAIPYGVPRKEWERLGRDMAKLYAEDGHAVDFSLHLGEDGTNPHVHMLLSTRRLTEDGFAKTKIAGMDKRAFVFAARKRWQEVANHWLSVSGSRERIDHRSYRERGLERTPGQHVRPDPVARARKRDIGQMMRDTNYMAQKPTFEEKILYPNLTKRDEWPPGKLYPTPDMSDKERLELAEYKDKLELARNDLQADELTGERAGKPDTFIRDFDAGKNKDKAEPAKEKADREFYLRDEHSENALYERDLRASIAEREQRRDDDAEMRNRAMQLVRTKDEHDRLTAAREPGWQISYRSEEVRKLEEQIIQERIAYLEKKDFDEYVRDIDGELYSRAMALDRTKDEFDRLEVARASGIRDGRKIMEEQIMRERMAFIKVRDQEESIRLLEEQEREYMRDKLDDRETR